MRWQTAIAVAIIAVASCAQASSYDDFSQGWNAKIRGDARHAVASFSAALTAGDLAPIYVTSAHLGRALAYLESGRCADALPDLDGILTDQPQNVQALSVRAPTYACLKNTDAAIADYKQIVHLHPDGGSYQDIALYFWKIGRFPDAAEMFKEELNYLPPSDSEMISTMLLYVISAERGSAPDEAALSKEMARFACPVYWIGGCRYWPRPLIDLFRGKKDPNDVYEDLKSDDAEVTAERTCTADFYVGEWHLLHQHADAAKVEMQKAVNECPHRTVEFVAARAELDRLSAGNSSNHV